MFSMALLDSLKKVYKINVICKNCGEFMEVAIPKGMTIEDYLLSERARCTTCGCNTIKRFEGKKIEKSKGL